MSAKLKKSEDRRVEEATEVTGSGQVARNLRIRRKKILKGYMSLEDTKEKYGRWLEEAIISAK